MLFMGIAISAQAQNMADVVYLKNGSVIKGIIVEQVPNESIKLQTWDGNLFVYKMDEIQKTTKEAYNNRNYRQPNQRQKAYNSSPFNKSQGYMGLVEVSGGIGVGNWAATCIGATIINGYRIFPQFAIGIGVGGQLFLYKYYNGSHYVNDRDFTFPIFAHLRSDFIGGTVSPFVAFNIGYNSSLTGGFFGGMMMEPQLGIGFNVGQKSRMICGAGFAVNRVKYYASSGYTRYYDRDWGYAINIRIGFSF